MKKLLKQFRYGQKGFTLIELLVVIAVLGILAAVVVPNVGKFLGAGTVEAANTEAHNVQTAVMAAMVAANVSGVSTTLGNNEVAPASPDIVASDDVTDILVGDFITGGLQATYMIDEFGSISAATPTGGGKWTGLTYTAGAGWE